LATTVAKLYFSSCKSGQSVIVLTYSWRSTSSTRWHWQRWVPVSLKTTNGWVAEKIIFLSALSFAKDRTKQLEQGISNRFTATNVCKACESIGDISICFLP